MADFYNLTAPNGSTFPLGSYLLKDPGPDFDSGGMFRSQFTENPYAEGGALSLETSGIRHFKFPLRLASHSTYGGIPQALAWLRQCAVPGAVIDLQPHYVASADVIRFDVVDGRVDFNYDVDLARYARMDATLDLGVQPFGYWPTWITLASAASVGLTGGAIALSAPIGDVPGFGEITIQPTTPSQYAGGSWMPDFIAWSMSARPSFVAFWPAASLGLHASTSAASRAGDIYAPGSQALSVNASYFTQGWWPFAVATIPAALEPAYRGHFRVFGYFACASQDGGYPVLVDAMPALGEPAMGSYNSGASFAPPVASGTPGGFGAQPSPAYQIVDMGEISLPPVASGETQDVRLRVWAGSGLGNAAHFKLGGLYLLPLDGPNGILPRGLGQPSAFNPQRTEKLFLQAWEKQAFIGAGTGGAAMQLPLAEAYTHYRGALPMAGASAVQLDLLLGERKSSTVATQPVIRGGPTFAAVSVRYRPRFAFLKSV